jgi:acetyltransferase-like isoleucine patch superfamily enzyme
MGAWLMRVRNRLALLGFHLWSKARFAHVGNKSFLYRPYRVDGGGRITIGSATVFQRGVWLYCKDEPDTNARIVIGDGCVFGYNNHITAVKRVEIGRRVLTANNVYISDNLHRYEDVSLPVMDQPVHLKAEVSIGDGSWIGENACIIGARVGKNCVVGANAVVTRDVPDYSVVVGSPAFVIKRFDMAVGRWVSLRTPRESVEK